MLRTKNNNILPLGERLLVRKDKAEEYTTCSGIIVPEGAQKRRDDVERGTVLAVGAEIEESLVGERVLFGCYSGTIIDDSDGLLMLKAGDVIGKEQ